MITTTSALCSLCSTMAPQQYYFSASMFVALSNRLHPSTVYLLLGSRFPQHQILDTSTFVNVTP